MDDVVEALRITQRQEMRFRLPRTAQLEMLDFSSIDVILTVVSICVPIGSSTFNHTKLWISESRPRCSLSKQKMEVLSSSVTLTGPLCQSHRAARQTSAPTPLSYTVGAEERCQTI